MFEAINELQQARLNLKLLQKESGAEVAGEAYAEVSAAIASLNRATSALHAWGVANLPPISARTPLPILEVLP
jgi:hypothetical protein